MNIGIVTFYNHTNYGAVLQSYAMQTALKYLGYNAFHIDFKDNIITSEPNLPNNPLFNKIKKEKSIRDSNFENFRTENLNICSFSIELVNECYKFIVGSDQVWNPEITNADDRFFLSFAEDSKKIAYACSIGDISDNKWKNIYANALSKFNKISIREKSVKNIVDQLSKNKSDVVLDPVFLLNKNEWIKFLDKKSISTKNPYLLLIMVQNDNELYNYWKNKATEMRLDFKIITASYFPMASFYPWSRIDVYDWLSLINNASLVVTSSFHGLAFSIIFEKKFIVSRLRNELKSRNYRIDDLLESLKLKDEDYGINASKELIKQIDSSYNWLKDSL